MWDDPFSIRMREQCSKAATALQFDPACNMVPLWNIYKALARSKAGAEPSVDELVSAYKMDSSATAH